MPIREDRASTKRASGRSRGIEFSGGVTDQPPQNGVLPEVQAREQPRRQGFLALRHHARHFHGHRRQRPHSFHLR